MATTPRTAAEPEARLRAYDWLVRRDAAPPGYDPLAPRKERRLALAKAAESVEAAATAKRAAATDAPANRKDGGK